MRSLASEAKSCDVEAVREDAGRAKVMEMMAAIRASSGPADVKASSFTKKTLSCPLPVKALEPNGYSFRFVPSLTRPGTFSQHLVYKGMRNAQTN